MIHRRNLPLCLLLAALAMFFAAFPAHLAAQPVDDGPWLGDNVSAPLWRVRGEYLLWWSNGNPLPPLVTTSPVGTPRTEAGVLGTPGAEILFGGNTIDTGARSGGRMTLSRWLESTDDTAVEFVGFFVGDDY